MGGPPTLEPVVTLAPPVLSAPVGHADGTIYRVTVTRGGETSEVTVRVADKALAAWAARQIPADEAVVAYVTHALHHHPDELPSSLFLGATEAEGRPALPIRTAEGHYLVFG